MDKIDSVRKMQTYIEDHLDEKITLSNLSNVSCYSPWYSYRLFIEVLGITPSEYIRKLKLSKSALELRDEQSKILEISLKYGYSSVDGYQRAFYKEFNVNPYEYSKNPKPICLFTPYKVYEKKGNKNVETKNIFIRTMTKPQRKAIIKRGEKATNYFDYCNEVGCDVWGILTSIKSISNEPICMWLPNNLVKKNTSIYVQGVEVSCDYEGEIPEGFEIIDLPECEYLIFQGEPFEEEDYEEAIKEVWNAMEKFNYKSMGYSIDDKNPKIQLEPIGERGYMELVPVKKIR